MTLYAVCGQVQRHGFPAAPGGAHSPTSCNWQTIQFLRRQLIFNIFYLFIRKLFFLKRVVNWQLIYFNLIETQFRVSISLNSVTILDVLSCLKTQSFSLFWTQRPCGTRALSTATPGAPARVTSENASRTAYARQFIVNCRNQESSSFYK